MLPVKVTISVQGKELAAEDVKDKSVRDGLQQMGRGVGTALAGITCPTHKVTAKSVRIHVSKSGDGDLKYDSCCAELQKLISKALG